jgi:protein TonB
MFGDIVDPSIKLGSKQGYSVGVTILIEASVIAAMVIIPLMAFEALPTPPSMMAFVAAPPPTPPPPPPPPPPKPAEVKPVEVVNPNAAPTEPPKEIKAEPVDTNFERAGVEGGVPGGVVGGVVGGLPEAPPPPPPPTQPVRVGGQIKQPTKTKHVAPMYPPIAQSARVQGVVIIEAIIGPNGRVQDAKVLRSIPLLDQAALDAVKQWEFTPTLLNNTPVPVIMTVTVQFTLS